MEIKKTTRSDSAKARALSLTPERRKEIAIKASNSRKKNLIKATHASELVIGDIKIPCYVLEDGKRVLLQKGMAESMGFATPSSSKITALSSKKFLNGLIDEDFISKLNNPIVFKTPAGNSAHGLEATILVDLCDSVLKARENNVLQRSQNRIAYQCEILMRGFARTGIIALVDEATGYQNNRARDYLAKILNAFIADELQPYVSMFPSSFFKELFRLRGLDFLKDGVKNPRYFGHLINNIVYKRLAPGVFEELKKKTPISQSGYKLAKYFQSLNPDKGMKALISHLGCVQGFMEISDNYDEFMSLLDRVKPLQIDIPQELLDSNLEQFDEHKMPEGI